MSQDGPTVVEHRNLKHVSQLTMDRIPLLTCRRLGKCATHGCKNGGKSPVILGGPHSSVADARELESSSRALW